MGKLIIKKLRKDWLAANGDEDKVGAGWKEFHDTFLSFGGPPIGLMRRAMLAQDEDDDTSGDMF
ncbi:MAG: hypothetical protein R3C68_13875 [Myxococcota bacterium]